MLIDIIDFNLIAILIQYWVIAHCCFGHIKFNLIQYFKQTYNSTDV